MRKLNLKKESLAELTTEELDAVVGGASGLPCVSDMMCNSDFQQCLTGLPCLSVRNC